MERMNKNHWFVNKDELSISLMRFHVSIKQVLSDNISHWTIIIKNSEMEELKIGFKTLEECILFTENYIDNSHDFNEIIEKKKEYKKITKPKQKVKRIEKK